MSEFAVSDSTNLASTCVTAAAAAAAAAFTAPTPSSVAGPTPNLLRRAYRLMHTAVAMATLYE